jgi:carbon-monoxide dehydrogenase small subunit
VERCGIEVDGSPVELDVDWLAEDLLFVLREHCGVRGPKEGCDDGQCGSCTVLIDGTSRYACLVLTGTVLGRAVTTVAGLGEPGGESALQRAFLDAGAVQCGFCTPGLIVAAEDLLRRHPAPSALTDEEIREALVGNLCRCTGYGRIIAAVRAAAQER